MRKSLFASTLSVSVMLFFLKTLGFVKQAMIAAYYGASIDTDIFFLASNFVSLVIFGLFSSLTVTLVVSYVTEKTKGQEYANALISKVFTLSVPVAILLSVMVIILARPIASILAPTYQTVHLILLTNAIRILSLVYIFYAISSIFTTVLDAEKNFLISKTTSAFYSIAVILCILILSQKFGIFALYTGFLIYLPLTCIYQYLFLRKKVKLQFKSPLHDKTISNLLFVTIPVFLGNTMVQLNSTVDNVVSSSLEEGAVSALAYAQTLSLFVVTIIISGASSVLFSFLASYIAEKNNQSAVTVLNKSLGMMVFVLIPISVITVICREDIVKIIFMRGEFHEEALKMSSMALLGYGIGFCFFGVRELTIKAIYAYGDTKTPMYNSICSITINIILNVILSRFWGIAGISISTSIANLVSMILSLATLKRHMQSFSMSVFIRKIVKLSIGGCVATIAILFINSNILSIAPLGRFVILTCVCVVIYVISLLALKSEEITYLTDFITRKKK